MCLCKEIIVGAVFRGDDPGAEILIFTPSFNVEINTFNLMTAGIESGENYNLSGSVESGRVFDNT